MAHPRARLTVFGRQLLVSRVDGQGWPVALAAESLGISRATAYKWLRRQRAEGSAGLEDRSSRPARSPRRLPAEQVARIVRLRARRRYGPHRLAPLAGHPRSTIYAVLRRAGLSRLRDADRVTAAPVRYTACHPGALLHQDHKKLGRIPPGGGHRVLGRERRRRDRTPIGYDHFGKAAGGDLQRQRRAGAALVGHRHHRHPGVVVHDHLEARDPHRAGADRQRLCLPRHGLHGGA